MKRIRNATLRSIGLGMGLLLLLPAAGAAKLASPVTDADRAVEIARRSRDRVEMSGKQLQSVSSDLFSEFARNTIELQRLIDGRRELEEAGFLNKETPDGAARRAHINGAILQQVGELKKVCDDNLPQLLAALESFDGVVADSLVDTQATRSINSNYELSLGQYLKQERRFYLEAAKDAQGALEAYQTEQDDRRKEQLRRHYLRARSRIEQLNQRRQLYEARLKAAEMNQKVSDLVRAKIRNEGHQVPTHFRQVMSKLYNTFARITSVAEVGGTDTAYMLSNVGFDNLAQVNSSLQVVDDAIGKLDGVLDDMVNDVLGNLDTIRQVGVSEVTAGAEIDLEEEMAYLRAQREKWLQ